MRIPYYALTAGLSVLLFLICTPSANGQMVPRLDNPMLDTPPFPLGGVGSQGPTGLNVITSVDGWDNFDLGTTNAEPHMVTNPLRPQWFFNAFNTNTTFHTEDGLNWTTNNPAFPSAAGDPVAAYDSLGTLYYETMKSPITGCWVVTSTNNGLTWSSAVTSVNGNDKNWIAADQTRGPFANYVYTTMTNSGQGSFARSTDRGLTWDAQRNFTPHSLPGMMVAVGPNVLSPIDTSGGCVYVVTHSGTNAAGVYTFFVSRDGGLNFVQKSQHQFSNLIGTEVGGRSTVQFMRCRPYPFIAADNSFGPYRGRLYLVYASNNPAGNGNKSDIFLRFSTDQGGTWSSPRIVNDDPNSQNNFQFHPAIWCDKETGRLYIKFYDTRLVPTSDSMDVYATYTDDGGNTFAPNQRLTNRTFRINITNATTATYRGDYDAITSNRFASLAVWTDFRNAPSPNYTGMTAYFPDFAMLARATRDTLKFTDSTTAIIRIPAVKLYTYGVKFVASVSPAAPFELTWPQGDSLASVPDSITLKIKTNNVPTGNYTVSIIGRGPNGTPIHRRTLSIRVQFIPNSVTVLQPNGGEFWIQGQTKQIRWTRTGDVGNVRLEYSTNNGTNWTQIIASTPAEPGSYNWLVPSVTTTQGRVRVTWVDSSSVTDQSDNAFTISGPAALISIANDSLRATAQVGNNFAFDTLRISNTGTITLNWNTTGPSWANGFPSSGSVPADSTRRAPVRFNAAGLLGGMYLGTLAVSSNDPQRPTVNVPVRFTVIGVPHISATPRDTLNFGFVRVGRTDTMVVRVRNVGTDTLRTTNSVNPPGRFGTLTPTVKLAPNDSTNIRVVFTPLDSTLSYVSTLRIITNDPDPEDDTVFVTLFGRGAGTSSVRLVTHNLIPDHFVLEQNYPNPFNPSTTIRFGIPAGVGQSDVATLSVFDVLGREVTTLVNEKLAPGTYSAHFETTGLSSGIYFYRLTAGNFVHTRKMILAK